MSGFKEAVILERTIKRQGEEGWRKLSRHRRRGEFGNTLGF